LNFDDKGPRNRKFSRWKTPRSKDNSVENFAQRLNQDVEGVITVTHCPIVQAKKLSECPTGLRTNMLANQCRVNRSNPTPVVCCCHKESSVWVSHQRGEVGRRGDDPHVAKSNNDGRFHKSRIPCPDVQIGQRRRDPFGSQTPAKDTDPGSMMSLVSERAGDGYRDCPESIPPPRAQNGRRRSPVQRGMQPKAKDTDRTKITPRQNVMEMSRRVIENHQSQIKRPKITKASHSSKDRTRKLRRDILNRLNSQGPPRDLPTTPPQCNVTSARSQGVQK
jgi:hypothetical protein